MVCNICGEKTIGVCCDQLIADLDDEDDTVRSVN